MYKDIQDFPVSDSTDSDVFEAIVELHYQLKGYITSNGKWVWVWEEGKQQRGYQDIDVLAVGEHKTVIVSVTSNLNDKISTNQQSGDVNRESLENLKNYFDRVERYLSKVPQYRWLIANDRVERTIAYGSPKTEREVIKNALQSEGISLLSAGEMIDSILKYLEKPNWKTQNQILKLLQIFKYWDMRISR
jgi:hypothetical protein